jgi:hypothetical protein
MKKLFVCTLFFAGTGLLLAGENSGENGGEVDGVVSSEPQAANENGAKPNENANPSQEEGKNKSEDEPFDFSALLGAEGGDE